VADADTLVDPPLDGVVILAVEQVPNSVVLGGQIVNYSAMPQVYSDLHARIQDQLNVAGVEILSPRYPGPADGVRTGKSLISMSESSHHGLSESFKSAQARSRPATPASRTLSSPRSAHGCSLLAE
jgi:hypothetical protein